MFDARGGFRIVQVDGGEAKSVEKSIGLVCGVVLENGNAVLDVDWWLLGEGTLRVKMIEKNDRACHSAKAEHVGGFVLEPEEKREERSWEWDL